MHLCISIATLVMQVYKIMLHMHCLSCLLLSSVYCFLKMVMKNLDVSNELNVEWAAMLFI